MTPWRLLIQIINFSFTVYNRILRPHHNYEELTDGGQKEKKKIVRLWIQEFRNSLQTACNHCVFWKLKLLSLLSKSISRRWSSVTFDFQMRMENGHNFPCNRTATSQSTWTMYSAWIAMHNICSVIYFLFGRLNSVASFIDKNGIAQFSRSSATQPNRAILTLRTLFYCCDRN